MSHTTTVKTVPFRDISALRTAVERLNTQGVRCSLAENAVPRMYFENQEGPCDYVVQLHDGQYDVGFRKEQDGTYSPVFDEWNGYVAGKLAVAACPAPGTPEERQMRHIGALTREYSRCAAVNAAAAAGYFVESETVDAKGEYALTFAN